MKLYEELDKLADLLSQAIDLTKNRVDEALSVAEYDDIIDTLLNAGVQSDNSGIFTEISFKIMDLIRDVEDPSIKSRLTKIDDKIGDAIMGYSGVMDQLRTVIKRETGNYEENPEYPVWPNDKLIPYSKREWSKADNLLQSAFKDLVDLLGESEEE